MDDDEWGLSMEELDSLENNAKKQLAERQRSSSTASVSPPRYSYHGQQQQRSAFASPRKQMFHSPSRSSGPISKMSIKFFVDHPGRIGVQAAFNKHLVGGFKMVPGHEWDANRRIWHFPATRFEEVVRRITTLPEVSVDVEATPPLMLPPGGIQDQRQTASNMHLSGSPLNLPQRSQAELPEPVGDQTLASPPRLQLFKESAHTNSSKSPIKAKGSGLVAQIYLMDPDHVAVRSPFNLKVKEACQSVPGRVWNAEERVLWNDRVWVIPRSKMEELVEALSRIPVTVEAVPPLCLPAAKFPVRSDDLKFSQSEREPAPSSSQTKSESVNVPKALIKLYLHHSGDIAAKFEYNAKIVAAMRTVPRAEWNPKERLWLFPISSVSEAEKIMSNISDLDVSVEGLEPLVRRAIEAAAAVPNLLEKYNEVPEHLETKLLPFQRDGVRFALQRGCRVMIADEMGLGKTLQAIAVVSCLEEDWPVLIVVPSSLRLQWAMSLQQWLDIRPSDITVFMSQYSSWNKEGFNIVNSATRGHVKLDGLFNIVSYDLVTKLADAISEAQFKIIIADEAHYLKNAQAKRTNACVPLLQKAKYAVLLSGTPALSRPIELFKQLEALQPTVYKNGVSEYGNRYCLGGHFGMYQGSSNLQELHALVKSTVMIRRLKKDVLSELPQKRRQQVFVSLEDKGIRHMKALFHELNEIKDAMKLCKEDEKERMKYSEKQLLNKIYTESAVVKLPAVQEYLTTMIDAECKFLVFAHHQSMLDGIEQLLMKKKVGLIRIDGGTPQSARQALVTRFQENDNIIAAVLGIRAAGVGLTLTAASTVIFAEMSWTPGDLVQAEDRAHRIGQASSVNVYYLHAHDTIDDIIWDTVQNKLENLSQVLDGQENTLQVAAPPKTYAHVPRGQSTLDSFLHPSAAASLNQPQCEGNSSLPGSDFSTSMRDEFLFDPELVEEPMHVTSSANFREPDRSFNGHSYPPQMGQMGDPLKRSSDRIDYDGSDATNDYKRKRLF
ncbi:uncharacterized protein [Physcomitrium patens]|uniref:SNF2 family DNA-dependent ATPase n=1 Tax=Physcomitrium patens TaxID=3218 RepID=A0A7I4BAP5_PHYPA|nr:SWI/SNF-related matrix-associated actin-dependent regulator of chromatin subfamily A-like protein 1 homolog isoform X3 [Physcomitrium patens]|eukprot:XP_024398738.1 SWI/SNF-related matrix-associated actin-dependent regulator of chromatin subfamily A-like protein 1 homolog isoform X3 [Physcomitrella patens]